MPNWCANRLFFRAEPGNITDIRHLLRGSLSPFYQQAVQEGIHLFVAGCAGLLQPVDDFHYAPYPVLTQAGRGIVSPENLAFTRWLGMLQSGVELDEKNCRTLHEIWLQSGIGERRWESLSGDAQAAVGLLYDRKHFDWNGLWHKTAPLLRGGTGCATTRSLLREIHWICGCFCQRGLIRKSTVSTAVCWRTFLHHTTGIWNVTERNGRRGMT